MLPAKEIHPTNQKYAIYRDIPRPSQDDLAPFQGLGVADVLEGLAPSALMDPNLHPVQHGAAIIGPALTVLNTCGDTLMLHYAVEICQKGDVLVLVSEGDSPSAVWGKMVTVVARARGVAGVIVDGHVRDTAYIRETGFPVWARSVSPRGSTRKGPGSINVPVQCGNVTVNPGDLIMADDDGIMVIPPEQLQSALAAAQRRAAREASIMAQLEQGISPYRLLNMEETRKASDVVEHPGRYSQ